MNLQMDRGIGEKYTSNAQKIRVITENWVATNMFCPYCGNPSIMHFENNRPVADFFCPICNEEYEVKSKGAAIGNKVNDGAYKTMVERIQSVNNPNFLFMQYNKNNLQLENLMMVPKYFFNIEIIEKRKPLADTARRAGWEGCNILLNKIPNEGRVFIVKNKKEIPIEQILRKVQKTKFVEEYGIGARGWILDIFNCMSRIETDIFTLQQMYQFETQLAIKHPDNHHIKEKIRQQLQILRDNGLIEFLGRGYYRKIL